MVWGIAKAARLPAELSLLAYASSWVALVFHGHSFSNTTESFCVVVVMYCFVRWLEVRRSFHKLE